MSEKLQHTTAHMRVLMEHRYGDSVYHKHNKDHSAYRLHCKSHPHEKSNSQHKEDELHESTGHLHELGQQKVRKRMAKGRFH